MIHQLSTLGNSPDVNLIRKKVELLSLTLTSNLKKRNRSETSLVDLNCVIKRRGSIEMDREDVLGSSEEKCCFYSPP